MKMQELRLNSSLSIKRGRRRETLKKWDNLVSFPSSKRKTQLPLVCFLPLLFCLFEDVFLLVTFLFSVVFKWFVFLFLISEIENSIRTVNSHNFAALCIYWLRIILQVSQVFIFFGQFLKIQESLPFLLYLLNLILRQTTLHSY